MSFPPELRISFLSGIGSYSHGSQSPGPLCPTEPHQVKLDVLCLLETRRRLVPWKMEKVVSDPRSSDQTTDGGETDVVTDGPDSSKYTRVLSSLSDHTTVLTSVFPSGSRTGTKRVCDWHTDLVYGRRTTRRWRVNTLLLQRDLRGSSGKIKPVMKLQV